MEISTKKYHIWDLVLKLNSRLSFLPPFTGGKKCLEFPLRVNFRHFFHENKRTAQAGITPGWYNLKQVCNLINDK